MRNKVINREKIIQAAAEVIANRGLEKATVDEISEVAGIAKGSVYSNFKSKEELLLEGAKYFVVQRIHTLKTLLTKYSTATQKLKNLMAANQRMAERDPEMFYMNYALMISTHKNLMAKSSQEFFKQYLDLVDEIIKEGIEKDEFHKTDSRTTALAVVLTQDLGFLFGNESHEIIDYKTISQNLLNLILTKNGSH